jgi:NTP pyrophosphatase (non-canonical NTP hydrolase)
MMLQPKMTTDEEVYANARARWGDMIQINVAIEELGELISALMQHRRGRCGRAKVAEEIADVHIVVEQLINIFGRDNFRKFRAMKMRRLWRRLQV